MKLKPGIIGFVLAALFVTSPTAHPLGNFSVNQYSRIEPGSSRITVHQVLDLAEIPTFQLIREIDTDSDGAVSQGEVTAYADGLTARYRADLNLAINSQTVPLTAASSQPVWGKGAGDLPTLTITWIFIADLPSTDGANRVSFQNQNYSERSGWNEIVVSPAIGVSVYDSSAYGNSTSEDLRNTGSMAPLSERSAQFSFTSGTVPAGAKQLRARDGQPLAPVQNDTFAGLITVPEITPIVALLGLLAAFGLGAVHAMSPGHGKTVVGAYLVGSRGNAKHAVFLGLVVTITHTLGVFVLGAVTLFASNYILSERLMPFLGFISGLLVLFIGITLFKERFLSFYRGSAAPDHTHEHEHEHDVMPHTHGGTTHSHGGVEHSHAMPEDVTWRSLLALGISGGLLPCPSALVLMLSAISLNRVGYGLVLIVVFSFGLAATLTGIGLIFLYIGKAFGNTSLADNRIVKALPVFSAFVVTFLGAVICYNSLV